MREDEIRDWRGALVTARLAPKTGMVPLKSSTLLAVQAEIERLRAENAELRTMLTRYRLEVPLGHQPHMLAHAVDVALGRA